MSSREIAELCDKEHRNVLADIRTMCEQLNLDVLTFQHIYLDSMNREIATLCDKEHRNVCRDIENLNLEYGKLSLLKIEQCDFTVNQDFTTVSKNLENGGRSIEYYITLDMANFHSPKLGSAILL